jgi:long-chain acyl-CoA synthetase
VETNLAKLAELCLERLGDHRSLFFEGTWHSTAGLQARIERVAYGLVKLGVRPGDRVVVIMTNCPEVTILYHAAWRAGAVVTPVIFLVSVDELTHIIDDSGAVLVVTTPELLPKVTAATSTVPVVVVGQDSYAALEAAEPGSIVDRSSDDLAALLYTGGTTGRSKGVPLTHANLAHAGSASSSVSRIPGIARGQSSLPLSHSYGLLVTVGGLHRTEPFSSVLQRWFEPASFLTLAAEHGTQVAAVVPSMLVMLLAQPLEDHDLSELRHVYSGAAPLADAVIEEFQRRVPGVTVLEGYGCTETAAALTGTPADAPRRGTVGKALPGMEIRIIGDDGAEVPVGEDGEIIVHGPSVMRGYWRGEPIVDGWFHTGDVGRLDKDGYLTIVDRIKDIIIRGGYNIYPRDIEDVLLTHPAVLMAAVVGAPDDRLGEEVVAFVSLVDGAGVTPDELIAFAKERLSSHKYPRQVRIVDAVPLTSVGKLDRKRLRSAL